MTASLPGGGLRRGLGRAFRRLELEGDDRPGDQVVLLGGDDLATDQIAGLKLAAPHPGDPVDVGGVGVGAAKPEVPSFRRRRVDQDVERLAHQALIERERDRLLGGHDPVTTLERDRLRQVAGELGRRRVGLERIGENAESLELRRLDEIRRSSSNSASVSPGKPTMNVVRRTSPGMVARSREMIASLSSRVCRRFISLSKRSLMCWSGISR